MGPLKTKQIQIHMVGCDNPNAVQRGDFIREFPDEFTQRGIAAIIAQERPSVFDQQCQGDIQYYH